MIVCIIVLCNSLTIVPVEHTGVILHFGATTSKTLGDGWHFKIPFVESVVDISNKVMKSDVSANSTSKDLQAITCNISINYHLAAENSADMYKNVGLAYDDTLLQPQQKRLLRQRQVQKLFLFRRLVSLVLFLFNLFFNFKEWYYENLSSCFLL